MLEEDRIFKINIENEMKTAYIDYSMSVIVSRALPDVRDGMKPVHRRVLYGMNESVAVDAAEVAVAVHQHVPHAPPLCHAGYGSVDG